MKYFFSKAGQKEDSGAKKSSAAAWPRGTIIGRRQQPQDAASISAFGSPDIEAKLPQSRPRRAIMMDDRRFFLWKTDWCR